jgi:hypothetical protein
MDGHKLVFKGKTWSHVDKLLEKHGWYESCPVADCYIYYKKGKTWEASIYLRESKIIILFDSLELVEEEAKDNDDNNEENNYYDDWEDDEEDS